VIYAEIVLSTNFVLGLSKNPFLNAAHALQLKKRYYLKPSAAI